ncbi:Uu.00g112450.m01.CDS01 [Anthostomella pinea]|uniref:Uu.00g112450.m01.CDS01 n=1 Tax=Anthostomella pinea TaxID=933095 RepID=A0AAI8VFZ7_9PEZI|nr:Uu.00g112450.m01.CDS01 [Anthostomella pinea]
MARGLQQVSSAAMLRPRLQQLCPRALARPIGPLILHDGPIFLTIKHRTAASQASRPRHFTTTRRQYLTDPSSTLPKTSSSRPEATLPVDAASTTAPTPSHLEPQPQPVTSTPESSSDKPAPPRRRRRRGIYYSVLFLVLGTTLGTFFRLTIAPPAPPARGSTEDAYLLSSIQAQGAALPLVRQLSADPAWTSWDAYGGASTSPDDDDDAASPNIPTHKRTPTVVRSRITSGPLSGSSGLAFQRVFHNAHTGEVISVLYFGAGTAGWPGVVHGGALATVLDESLGRCAILRFPSRTGVTANLELQYRAPTMTNAFYVVRTRPAPSDWDEAKSERKMWVQGTLEDAKGGRVCVEAKALFVVPKGFELKPLVKDF